MNNSDLFVVTLVNVTKSRSNRDFVDISKLEEANLFLIIEINETFVLIYSRSNVLFWYVNFEPIVFAFILKSSGSNVNLTFFNLRSNLLFVCLILFIICLLNLSVSRPNILKYIITIIQ